MNKRLKLIAGIFWVTTINCYAQIKEFDPLLDSKATVIPAPSQEEWNSNYMWYPGQLAAFYHQGRTGKGVMGFHVPCIRRLDGSRTYPLSRKLPDRGFKSQTTGVLQTSLWFKPLPRCQWSACGSRCLKWAYWLQPIGRKAQ